MTKIIYETHQFRQASLDLIELANGIIQSYGTQGYTLTLRQLYYQMVARDMIPNNQREYKKLGKTLAKARRAGLVSWEAIEDRTRNLAGVQHWHSPGEIIRAAMRGYKIDKWANQPKRVEVWIEKDALLNVLERACRPLDVDWFSCRGYTSESEMWRAGHSRLRRYIEAGQQPIIIHLGDHDPSGIDMTRDIVDRLALYSGHPVEVTRAALNMDQVDEYEPPANPAKFTDSRASQYVALHGTSSWELDALEPTVLQRIITSHVLAHRNPDLWEAKVAEERADLDRLERLLGDLS